MIEIIDLLKPKNGGNFKLIEDIDIAVDGYSSLADCVAHMATTAMIEAINAVLSGKQDKLTTAQLEAVNSGITSELVTQIGTNTAAIAGKADSSDLTTATANLQAQIDELITPVTQDAEVQNARVGADGTSYQTLKARLDDESRQTNYAINSLFDSLGTEYESVDGTFEAGTFYLKTSPNTARSLNTYQTRTVALTGSPLKAKISGYLPANANNLAICLCLDSSYELIKSFGDGGESAVTFNETEIKIPSGTKYLRVVSNNAVSAAIKICKTIINSTDYNDFKNEVNADILEISGEIYVETAGTFEEQTYYTIAAPNTAQSNTTYQTRTVSTGTSKKAKITGYLPADATGIAVCLCLDSNYDLISSFGNGSSSEVSLSDYEINLPNGTAYIRVVTKNSVPATIKLCQKGLTYNTFNSFKAATVEELNSFESKLSSAIGSDDTSVVPLTGSAIISNEYIGRDGNVKSATGFSRTGVIHLTKGSSISATVAAYVGTFAITVAIVSEYNADRGEYLPLVPATDSALTNYTYIATKDMDVVISFKNNDSNTASKTIHTSGSIEPLFDFISPDSSWVCFGDSITGIYTTPCIPDMMSARYGCEVYNVGFPGTRARTRTDTDYKYFDFQALADAIVSGDFTNQEEHLSGVTSIYAERLATLESIDFSKVTNAYFFYGTNDFNGSQTVQGMKDALLDGISRILTKYPNITPVLITPMFRFKVVDGNVIFLDDPTWTNGADKKLTDYISGVVEVGGENYIPVLNLLETLGITKYNYTKFFDVSDGTHPSDAGIQKIGKSIAAKLEYLNSV